jgi:gluconolactonase
MSQPCRLPRGAIAGLLSRPACSTNQANLALMKMLQKLVCRCAFAVVALPLLAQTTNPPPPKNLRIIRDSMPSPAQTTNSTPSVIAEGAKLELLAGGFKFAEGATCDAAGNVFFTDQPNNRIMEWSVEGKLSTFLQPAGRANGMYFDAQGNLLACADEKTELWSITPDGKHTVLAKEFDGKPLNGPNDVWVRPDGGMYLTDPFYDRPWWDYHIRPQDSEQVYFLSADRQPLRRVTADLNKPNGISGTPDGKTLFVADIGAGKTYAYDIQTDGTLAGKRLVCQMGSDGMTVDNEGNFYLTGRGVTVFDKTGKRIEKIDVAEPWVGNLCFGGKDHQTLFLAASKGLYAIHLRVKGANAAK